MKCSLKTVSMVFAVLALHSLAVVAIMGADLQLTVKRSTTVSFQAEIGKFYRILGSTNVTSPTWETVEDSIIGEGTVVERSYDDQSYAYAFFKCAEVKPDFTGMWLTYADFRGVPMQGTHFENSRINSCDFAGVDISGSSFIGSTLLFLDLTGANLQGSTMEQSLNIAVLFQNANLAGVNLNGASFKGCDFTGAVGLDGSGASFEGCIMPDGKPQDP